MTEVEYMMEPEPEPKRKSAGDGNVRDAMPTASISEALRSALRMHRTKAMSDLAQELEGIVDPTVESIKGNILRKKQNQVIDVLRDLDIYSADIEHHCSQLARQLMQNSHDGHLISLKTPNGSVVPISDASAGHLKEISLFFETGLATTEHAVAGFAAELKLFIVKRMVGQFFFPHEEQIIDDGADHRHGSLPIHVHSLQSGARVDSSPAYFIDFKDFSSPTSPAKGSLVPGRYIFRISTGTGEFYDRGVFDVPDSFNIQLTV